MKDTVETKETSLLRTMLNLRLASRSEENPAIKDIIMEKEMATHSSVLAWRIPGMGEPGGLPSVGSHRVRHD